MGTKEHKQLGDPTAGINGWRKRWRNVLAKVHVASTEDALEDVLSALLVDKTPRVLAFVNAHAMNMAAESTVFAESLCAADILFRDGSGMASLYKMQGISAGLNLNGTDLIPRLIKKFSGSRLALFGTAEPYLEQAKIKILTDAESAASSIVTMHGFREANEYLQIAKETRPALIVLGMGMPKQEKVAREIRDGLDFPCLIVCGGAIIDFLGGKVSRAPRIYRAIGCEWAYRLFLEPRRLFRRYVIGNPMFLLRSLRYSKHL